MCVCIVYFRLVLGEAPVTHRNTSSTDICKEKRPQSWNADAISAECMSFFETRPSIGPWPRRSSGWRLTAKTSRAQTLDQPAATAESI